MASGARVYNLDETGCTTVQKPRKIIAEKGVKQVNQCTSGERGELVTVVAIICATGTFLPPIFVFPRKNMKTHMMNGSPTGSLGLASPSGWMTSELFPQVMEHFIKHTQSSKENPTLLICDNHESHISIKVVEIARKAGVTVLTLPPHTSNKLQPLDLAVFGPFKSFYNAAVDEWMLKHPGIPLTIYQVAECVGQAFMRSMTPCNIEAGFKKAGIVPFDPSVFTDSDFLLSAVIDRPVRRGMENENMSDLQEVINNQVEGAGPSNANQVNENQEQEKSYVSPQIFRSYPKAGARKKTGRRKRGCSTILTNTPVKVLLEEKEQAKLRKCLPPKRKSSSRKLFLDSAEKSKESSTEEEDVVSLHDSSEDELIEELEELDREPVVNDFVLVRFPKSIFYIGKIMVGKDKGDEFEISYLRKSRKCFVWPNVADIATVHLSDIVQILPKPIKMKTERLSGFIRFNVSFGELNVR